MEEAILTTWRKPFCWADRVCRSSSGRHLVGSLQRPDKGCWQIDEDRLSGGTDSALSLLQRPKSAAPTSMLSI